MPESVLFSYPPGTGGDHIIRMLDSQQHHMVDKVVVNYQSLKYLDFESLFGQVDNDCYLQKFDEFKQLGVTVVGTHRTDLTGIPAIPVKLTWTDPNITCKFVFRDIIVNDFSDEFVTLKWNNLPIWRVFQYPKNLISDRQKVALFTSFAVKQLPIDEYQLVPDGWISFNVDNIFSMNFVDDVLTLANTLKLAVNFDQIEQKQKAWLERNPGQAFNFRNAVRALEQREWIKQRLAS